jgi:hypothetical protein
MSGMDVLSQEERIQIIGAIVGRNNMRTTVRLTGVPRNRIKSLLMKLGPACAQYQHHTLRQLAPSALEWREAFVFRAKAGNTVASYEYSHTTGSVWTLACLDQRTKLVPSWRIGPRNPNTMQRLRADVVQRYAAAATGASVSSGYAEDSEILLHVCPDWFATLDHGLARKVERHAAVMALYFLYYNFALVHPELGTTPAMAAGKATYVWRASEILELIDPPATIRCTDESAPRQE